MSTMQRIGRQGSAGDHAVIDIITPAPKPGRAEERGRPKCGQLTSLLRSQKLRRLQLSGRSQRQQRHPHL
jgi:hypothetical protein